ncbi:MFS transporter [Nocardiopsis alba]|nr:MFS transporter [Nocardiopsis alba]
MNTPTPPMGPPARAGRREWLGLAALALPTLLLSLDMSVLYLALPHLAADLRPTGAQTLWIMDVYGFMIAGFLVTMGTLGDRIGRRRLLMIGATAFGLASIAAAFSTSAEALIATRVLMGIAGATLMPSTLALIGNMFVDPAQRAMAISIWTGCFMGGTAIGPVVGGLLLQWFWWGSVFLLGVPVMVLLLVCAPLLLPEYRDPSAGRLDLFSAVLSLAAILPVVFALKTAAEGGAPTTALAAGLLGLAMGVWFVRRQLRLADPLVDLSLFRERSFGAALFTMLVGAVAMGGTFLLISQYLQMVAGHSPLVAGLWLVIPAVAMIGATLLAAPLAQRIGRAKVIGGGMLVGSLGFTVLLFVPADGGGAMVILGLLLTSTGVGPGAALIADIVVGAAPRHKAGSAASLSETSGEFGIAIGVALLGSLASAVYRNRLEVPDGVDGEEARTLAEAVATAEGLPPGRAERLLAAASEAFTDGLNVTAGLGVVAMVACGVLALILLRGSDRPREDDAESDDGTGAESDPEPSDEFPAPTGSVRVRNDDTDPTGRLR